MILHSGNINKNTDNIFQKLEAISKRSNAIEKRLSEHDIVIDEIRVDNHNGFDALFIELNKPMGGLTCDFNT